VQVQSSSSSIQLTTIQPEVIVEPTLNINTETTENSDQKDYDFPITIRKGTRACTRYSLFFFSIGFSLFSGGSTNLNTVRQKKQLIKTINQSVFFCRRIESSKGVI